MAAMKSMASRRWLQFSLRTAFVLWTIAAAWLGWNVYVVRERRTALEAMQPDHNFWVNTASDWSRYWSTNARAGNVGLHELPAVSKIRVLLGDEAVQAIWCSPDTPKKELERLKRLFPEAQVVQGYWSPIQDR
jgi:hypothetical protein